MHWQLPTVSIFSNVTKSQCESCCTWRTWRGDMIHICISPCMHAISIRSNVLHCKIYAGISISSNKAPTLVLPIIVMMGDKSTAYQLWTLKGVDYIQTYTFFNVKNSFCEPFFRRLKPSLLPHIFQACVICAQSFCIETINGGEGLSELWSH